MRCKKCGNNLNKNANFCDICGEPVVKRSEGVKRITLRCEHCGGTLEIDANREIISCPFCGSKSIVLENDDVKIERIRANAYKDVEFRKIDSQDRIYREREAKNKEIERKQEIIRFKNSATSKLLLLGVVLCGYLAYKSFSLSNISSCFLALIQACIFCLAWCMGMDIIHERKKYIRILITVIGLILFFPSLKSCAVNEELKTIPTIKWSIIDLGEKIPEPKSKAIEIHDNNKTDLWIDVYNTSEEDYYEYIASCKEMGYTITVDNSLFFEAYDEIGNFIDLSYSESHNKMSINFEIATTLELIDWDQKTISAYLPKPKKEYGAFILESNEEIRFIISGNLPSEYDDYLNSCINYGYSIDSEKNKNSYGAYNKDGNYVWLKYNEYNKEIEVNFKYHMVFKEIEWPNKGIGSLTPIPKSTSVHIGNDYDWVFNVYVENMTFNDYEEYVKQCNEAGFDKNVRNYESSYWADYSDDINIHISYEGYNIINIDIPGHDFDKDYSNLRRK